MPTTTRSANRIARFTATLYADAKGSSKGKTTLVGLDRFPGAPAQPHQTKIWRAGGPCWLQNVNRRLNLSASSLVNSRDSHAYVRETCRAWRIPARLRLRRICYA